jgi:hypothetical protein
MIVFVLLAALCLFHVLIVKATAWGFVAWFIALLIYNIFHTESRDSKEEDLVPPRGLGGYAAEPRGYGEGYVSSPPQGGGQSNTALLTLMKAIETRIPKEESGPSDARYEEPQVTYPMEMEA